MHVSLSVISALLLLSLPAMATPITYTVDEAFGNATAIGTITTDGKIGTLSTSDILDYTFTVSIGGDTVTMSKTSSSHTEVSGNELSATASELLYDYTGGFNYFGMSATFPAQPGAGILCFGNASGCGTGRSGASIGIDTDFVYSPNLSGLQEIGVAPTPEPSSIVLLASGALGAAGVLRRRLRQAGPELS